MEKAKRVLLEHLQAKHGVSLDDIYSNLVNEHAKLDAALEDEAHEKINFSWQLGQDL